MEYAIILNECKTFQTNTIVHGSGQCLTAPDLHAQPLTPEIQPCDGSSKQIWILDSLLKFE